MVRPEGCYLNEDAQKYRDYFIERFEAYCSQKEWYCYHKCQRTEKDIEECRVKLFVTEINNMCIHCYTLTRWLYRNCSEADRERVKRNAKV